MIQKTITECEFNKNGHTPVQDDERGEIVCQNCGYVIDERMMALDFYPDSLAESSASHIGNSTKIPYMKDVPIANKLMIHNIKMWDKRVQIRQKSNEIKRLRVSSTLCSQLKLPEYIKTDVMNCLTKAHKLKITRGRNLKGLSAAIILYVCRKYEIPKTVSEVSVISGTPKKKLLKYKKTLEKNLGTLNKVQSIESYVPKITSELGMEKYNRQIYEQIKKIKEKHALGGKSPLTIISAIIYCICLKNGENLSQPQVADAANTNPVSLRNAMINFNLIDL